MDTAATRTRKYSVEDPVLYLAFELGNIEWKLGFSVGFGQRPRVRTIPARDLEGLQREIELAKKRFGLPETARVVSCYEAGRDGFSRRTHLPSTAGAGSGRCGWTATWRMRGLRTWWCTRRASRSIGGFVGRHLPSRQDIPKEHRDGAGTVCRAVPGRRTEWMWRSCWIS